MKTMTEDECDLIVHTARQTVGGRWAYIEADSLKGKLAAAIKDGYDHRLAVLLALVDGVRYDLCDEAGNTLRKATVTETIASLLLGDEGDIKIAGLTYRVDLS